MSKRREVEVTGVVVGVAAALMLAGVGLSAWEQHKQVEMNIAQADAVLVAMRTLTGKPNVMQYIGPMLFKTDEHGAVYAQYADGWFPVLEGAR